MNISKITLGTAQIGFDYGIANVGGKPDFQKATKLLKFAWDNEIYTFDTSPGYGDSENIIGSFISKELKNNSKEIFVITKLLKVNLKKKLNFKNLTNYIREQINQSFKNLKIKKIPIYLLHHGPDIFLKNGLVIECLNEIKNEGLIEKFGISIYNPNEVEASLNFKEIDVIQVPINIFDNRIIKTGLLNKLEKNNYLIFARSIFLQGLFFINPKSLPKYLELAKEPLKQLRNLAEEFKMNPAKLSFLYVRDLPGITSLIIGSEKIEQISNNIKFLEEQPLEREIFNRINENFSEVSEKIINPSLWYK